MEALTAAGLATLAGVTEAEIGRMTDLGILVARDGPAPFRVGDLQKIRLAVACERAGLPMDGIAAAIRAGQLSFAFMEAAPYHRFGVPSDRTYRQVSQDTGISLEVLRDCLEAMGFAWTSPDDPVRDDELEVVPLVDLAISSGIVDRRWMTRVGRGYAEGLRLAARVENEAYQARFEEPVLASGLGQREAMEQASALAAEFVPLVDRAPGAEHRGRPRGRGHPCPPRAGAGHVLPRPGRLHPPHRGAGRPGGGRPGQQPGRPGRAGLAPPRWPAGQVARRRGHVPLQASRPGGGGGAGDGGAHGPGRAAAGPRRPARRAGGVPGRR